MLNHYNGILRGEVEPRYTVLQENGELNELMRSADELASLCRLCHHQCGAMRNEGIPGKCGVIDSKISSIFPHFGEERVLVPSLTVFFSGCNLDCVFCQNHDISTNPQAGHLLSAEQMVAQLERWNGEVKNINWVGGDPIPHLPYILRVLERIQMRVPQVWNSNMYMTEDALSLIKPVTDLFLTDLKYGNDDCALRLSGAPD